MADTAAPDAPRHRPECWCNGTGWRRELGVLVPCNLPQLTDIEHAHVFSLGTPSPEADHG